MNDRRVPPLAKWPFYAADLVLVGLAIWIVSHYPHPIPFWPATLIVACVAGAAVFGVLPHRMEYQTAVKLAEADGLVDAAREIRNVQTVAEQIHVATGQWQGVQEHSARTVSAAKEIAERIAAEAQAFADFMQKANDSEKAHLRLEVEKLRRGEGQWLQVLVNLLDHTFALYQAGSHSGQPNLQNQLAQFQEACREAVRRVGLIPFEAAMGEPFDAERHQLANGEPEPAPGARIAQTLATGYTFQGQLVRRTLVSLQQNGTSEAEAAQATSAESTPAEAEVAPTETLGAGLPPAETAAPKSHRPLAAEPGFRLESEGLATGVGDEVRQA